MSKKNKQVVLPPKSAPPEANEKPKEEPALQVTTRIKVLCPLDKIPMGFSQVSKENPQIRAQCPICSGAVIVMVN